MFSSAQYIKEKATPLEGDASLNRLIFMTADKKDEGNIKRRGYNGICLLHWKISC